eukprot:scaffold1382_cov429-Prasinococcus_capsulatus_cf.AAC.1
MHFPRLRARALPALLVLACTNGSLRLGLPSPFLLARRRALVSGAAATSTTSPHRAHTSALQVSVSVRSCRPRCDRARFGCAHVRYATDAVHASLPPKTNRGRSPEQPRTGAAQTGAKAARRAHPSKRGG